MGWCKPGTACLYNILMMSELCTVLSFGAGSVTKLVDGNRVQRLFHPKYPEEYLDRPERRQAIWEAVEAFYTAPEQGTKEVDAFPMDTAQTAEEEQR